MSEKSRFMARETRFEGRYGGSLRNTIYQAYRPFLGRTLSILGVGLVGRIVLLGNTNLIGYWVDSFCRAPQPCRAVPSWMSGFGTHEFVLLLAAATAIGFCCTLFFRTGVSRLSINAVSDIYDETTYRTSRLPMTFFDRNPAGRIITRFSSDYNSVFRIFGGPLAEFISLIFDLTAMTLLIGLASLWLLPIWLLQGVLNYLVYRWHLGRLRVERRELALRRSPGIAHFAETTMGASTIRAFNKEKMFETRFSALNDSYLGQRLRTVTALVRFSLSMGSVTAFMFLVTGLASLWLVNHGHMSIGSVGVAFTYLGLSGTVLQSFFEWLTQFEEAMTGLERMNEYLRLPLEPGQRLPREARFETGHRVESEEEARASWNWDGIGAGATVEVKDLWMRYRADLPPVLQGLSFSLAAGERLAVVGRTGSGKTSLVQAIFRLYPLEKGTIRVGGHEAETGEEGEGVVPLGSYRPLLSYITQDATLFLGTLRENLKSPGGESTGEAPFARKNLGDGDLIQALRKVQFLRPEARDEEYAFWLDYRVEEKGRNLSAGERQLVCVARCLLQDTPVVVLDEATSAVDPRSEEILTRATDEFFAGKTQIIIAHRLSTVRSCDRMLWLQEGKVHRLGPTPEVMPEFQSSELLV
jgi:ABC-type multidrug transport system fused ATPase/permease subunit